MELHLPRGLAFSIKRVIDDRQAQAEGVSTVDPELMGAAGHRLEGDPGVGPFKGKPLEMSQPHLTMDGVIDLVRTPVRVQAEGELNGAALLRQVTLEKSEIVLLGPSFLKLDRKVALGFPGEGQDEEAGGVHIKPMNLWVRGSGRVGEADPMGDRVSFFWTAARNRKEAGGLIHDDDV